MKITTLAGLIKAVKESMDEYLDIMDVEINPSGFFTCLNPAHADRSPSMHVIQGSNRVLCFGCHASYDTIDLASIHNGIGIEGEDFIRSVKAAADDLEIEYELHPPTDKEIRQSFIYSLYGKVANAVTTLKYDEAAYTAPVIKYIKDHKWSRKTVEKFQIGALSEKGMLNLNLSPQGTENEYEWLRKYDLIRGVANTGIFSKDRLIFPQEDEKGHIVGFTSRLTTYSKENRDDRKYLNTSGSIVSTYHKGDLLYNYQRAKRTIIQESLSDLYVVEGQPDVITLDQAGCSNVVAIGTTSLSEYQVYLLKRSTATRLILCLDSDSSGVAGTRKILSTYLAKFTGMKVYVLELPGVNDADEYIRENGIDAFRALEPQLAIEWLLERFRHEMEPEDLAANMVPFIASFSSAIEREALCKKVALVADMSTTTILNDVDAIVNQVENTINNKVQDEMEDLQFKINRNPSQAISLLDEARNKIVSYKKDANTDNLSGANFASGILSFRDEAEKLDDAFPGYNFPMAPNFAQVFDNDWRRGKLLAFGGEENTGKSSFACFMMANLVIPEAENNVRGIYMTIDDSVNELIPKYIAIMAKHYTKGWRGYEKGFDLNLNHIVRPRYWEKVLADIDPQFARDMMDAYKIGYDKVVQLARQERLTMLGVPDVRNLDDARRTMTKYRNKYPDDNIYFFLDNIHKLPLPAGDARIGFRNISNEYKNMAVELELSVGGTLEYNSNSDKRGKNGRPTNFSLAESRSFRYDANAIVHMYNNLHVMQQEAIFYHWKKHIWQREYQKLPIVEAIIGKNKISSFKGVHFFEFHPGSSWFQEIPRQQAVDNAKKVEAMLEDGQADFGPIDVQVRSRPPIVVPDKPVIITRPSYVEPEPVVHIEEKPDTEYSTEGFDFGIDSSPDDFDFGAFND